MRLRYRIKRQMQDINLETNTGHKIAVKLYKVVGSKEGYRTAVIAVRALENAWRFYIPAN